MRLSVTPHSLAALTALCGALLQVKAGAAPAVQSAPAVQAAPGASAALGRRLLVLAERYYEAQVRFEPLNATFSGDNRFDDQLSMTIVAAVRAKQQALYRDVATSLKTIPRARLSAADRVTYDCLNYEVGTALALRRFPDHLLPMNHMDILPVTLANLAGGNGPQPLRTVAQYEAFLNRLTQLPAWIDAATANMREGMARKVVLPRALVAAILPQVKTLDVVRVEDSQYYVPIKNFPAELSPAEQARLTAAYSDLIAKKLLPSLRGLAQFLEADYLPASRASAGLDALPDGARWYAALAKALTTTAQSPEAIHATGLKEVERIRAELLKVGGRLGYTGAPAGVGRWLADQPATRPFKSEEAVLEGYRALYGKIGARLPELFGNLPQTKLEIRAEPPLSRDSASNHYTPAAGDGSRPGIFWAVIPDPAAYEVTEMTSLFLHEGVPGHHFQITLQQQMSIPSFRKFGGNNAYIEGWALYAETLGREMGLYDDPVAYAGHLNLEMTRAARLVVDTGLHAKGWTREQTIQYLQDTVGNTEAAARNATERYMAWPGQALGYKIGALKILALRQRASAALGPRFDLAAFHDAILADGSLPLEVLDGKIKDWIAQRR
ncbi:MAG: DUF885 domain-containing protein [Pseudomonadota bacterium]